jgi:3,4-dihydroxy 2-butanone 4-phosphate synthase / GTP cyclohydrolase II
MHVYETPVDPVEHIAMVKGDLSTPEPALVRVHVVSALSDLLGVAGSDGAVPSGSPVAQSLKAIADEGRGAVVLIRDLRPKSVSEWIAHSAERKRSAKTKAEKERRLVEIGVGSQILRDLGVRDMVLLSNAPPSRYVGIEAFGLRIVGQRRID